MNAAAPEPTSSTELPVGTETSWSPGRWVVMLAVTFAIHIGLIYALGNHKPTPSRPVKNAVTLQPVLKRSEALELLDPTVFAGPHVRGFAARTWLNLPAMVYPEFRWSEPPRLLALATEELGVLFLTQPPTNHPSRRQIEIALTPASTVLPPLTPPPPASRSTLRIIGPLAARKLDNPPANLPLQKNQDGLTNSIVQVLVDGAGRTFSPTLMPPGSGWREADQLALKIAGESKFSPSEQSNRFVVGTMVFEWQTQTPSNGLAQPE